MSLRTIARAFSNSWSVLLFLPRAWAGVLLVAVTFIRPWDGLSGALAVAGGIAAASLFGFRRDSIRDGLYGCNALLVGLAIGLGHPFTPVLAMQAVLAGAAAACLTAALSDAMWRGLGIPIFVLPFAILSLAVAPTPGAGATWELPVLPQAVLSPAWIPASIAHVLSALGAIIFQPWPLAGAVVLLVALATSRIGAATLLLGAAVGGLAASTLGATDSTLLVARYNGALTAAALAAFLHVPGRASLALGLLGAAFAGWLSVGLLPTFTALHVPITAWPFLLTALTLARAVRIRAADRPPFPNVLPGQTPEANFDYASTLAHRFHTPGPPAFYLPVRGDWAITQGVGGEHTHRGAWAHAWDFEILDARGFPFSGEGRKLEDYPTFGGSVHAAGAGMVEAVVDGLKDGDPGTLDSSRSWGNHIILRHGAELFTIVAHLKCGSIIVRAGQSVVAGDPIAQVGSSGRAPRPHLHFQAQRLALVGSPAIACRLTHYLDVSQPGPPRYIFSGVPEEGARLRTLAPAPIAAAFSALTPGLEFDLALESAPGERLRLRSEITFAGERSLFDIDRGHRLWFSLAWGDLAFTTCAAPRYSPLWALFVALPRLPITAPPHSFEDHPPAGALLPAAMARAHDFLRFVADPVRTQATATVVESAGVLGVGSRTEARLAGRVVSSFTGRVEIDSIGLRSFQLREGGPAGRVLVEARRPGPDPRPSVPDPALTPTTHSREIAT